PHCDGPITIVVRSEMVCVEPVTEVGGQRQRWIDSRLGKAFRDRTIAVDFLPCGNMAFEQPLWRQVARLEYHMLTIVELPILREDTACAVESCMQWRSRERRQQRETRQVNSSIDDKLGRSVEDIVPVFIIAENETSLDADLQLVQVGYQLAIKSGIIEFLVDGAKSRRIDRLEADEQARTAAACHGFHQGMVTTDQARGETEPFDLERHQGLEKLSRISPVRNQIEVDENDLLFSDPPNILYDVINRLLELLASPCRRSDAKFAIMRAGTCRLEDGLRHVVSSIEQIAARKRQGRQLEIGRLVGAGAPFPT